LNWPKRRGGSKARLRGVARSLLAAVHLLVRVRSTGDHLQRAAPVDLLLVPDGAIYSAECTANLNSEGRAVAEIRLTPTGHLCWEAPEGQAEPAHLATLRKAFSHDWREGLFTLAAEKTDMADSLTLCYWQGVTCLLMYLRDPPLVDHLLSHRVQPERAEFLRGGRAEHFA
jgi:hypothetical protein